MNFISVIYLHNIESRNDILKSFEEKVKVNLEICNNQLSYAMSDNVRQEHTNFCSGGTSFFFFKRGKVHSFSKVLSEL